ncbi:MAG: glycosyltransferase family 4 protein [Euryarchaeota archaeon]|nr:glycosyltransferase family 4 protein [Euryarchaeota archaeon]
MKKIVIYSPGWYPFLGGITTHVQQIIDCLPNYSFELVTNAVAEQKRQEKFQDNAYVIRIGPDDLTLAHPGHEKLPKYYYPYIVLANQIRIMRKIKYIKKSGADILHVHGPVMEPNSYHLDTKFHITMFSSSVKFSKIRCKKVLTCHGLASHYNHSQEVRKIEKRLLNQFDKVICVDEYIYEDAKKMVENHDKLSFIPNSVDTAQFSFKEAEPKEKLTIGYIGRLSIEREFSLVEKLIARKPDNVKFSLIIAGSDKKINEVKAKYSSPDIKISANIMPVELPKLIWEMDMLLNPVSFEGSSRATLEAMSCGRPAIMLDIGNRHPVINMETGFLIKNDVNDLLALLEKINNNREILEEMSHKARTIIENEYSNEVIIPKIKRIYDAL